MGSPPNERPRSDFLVFVSAKTSVSQFGLQGPVTIIPILCFPFLPYDLYSLN